MKNTYLTSYFPLISIVLFSVSLAVYFEMVIVEKLKTIGIYQGMLELSSRAWIQLAVLFLLCFLFFMLFSALKLLADTIVGLSLLFFSKDVVGNNLSQIRQGSIIYLGGGSISLLFVHQLPLLLFIFVLTTMIYFIYFVYKISPTLSSTGLIGVVFFHVIIWATFVIVTIFLCLKLYNSALASLPI